MATSPCRPSERFGVSPAQQANEIKENNDISTENADLRFGSGYTVTIALTYGFTYAVLHSTFSKISGAHFNPAITIAAVVARREKILPGVVLIIAQIIGSICGAGIYNSMSGSDDYGNLGRAKVNNHFDSGSIFGVELLSLMFISLVWFLHCDLRLRPLGRFKDATGPLYVGLAYAACAALTVRWRRALRRVSALCSSTQRSFSDACPLRFMLQSRWDGAALNPARALGPAAISGDLSDHWVYWIGPCFGGMSGALMFELLVWLSGGDRAKRESSWL